MPEFSRRRPISPVVGVPGAATVPDLDPHSPGNSEMLERMASSNSVVQTTPDPMFQGAPAEKKKPKKGTSVVNPAGIGGTRGDWNIGFKPTLSTSDERDNPQNEERATRRRQDEIAERRAPRVEKQP